jgi:hypothetical protein
MSHIPQRLHMASCRLISEALPAILSCAEDKELAKFHLSQSLQTFNTYQQPVLMALHQKMQSETAQMSEVQNWTGQGGLLIEAVRGVMWQFLVFTTASLELAPASNSQSPMLAQEVAMHFGELESILKRLSS